MVSVEPGISHRTGALCTDPCALTNPGSLTGRVLSVWTLALCQTWDLSQDGCSEYGPALSVEPGLSHRTGALCTDPCSLLNLGSLTGLVLSVWTLALCRTRALSQDGCSLYGPLLSVEPGISHRMGALCADNRSLSNPCSLTGWVLSVWTLVLC